MPDFKADINFTRRLALQVNPQPQRTHLLKVVVKLKLADDDRPGHIDEKTWKALLDHFDTDNSIGLQRGVFYLPDDIAEVDRFEAAALLQFLPEYFEPADEHSHTLLAAIQAGQYPLPTDDEDEA